MIRQASIASDTIAAIATPQGQGGIGIVRISGQQAHNIAQSITGKTLVPRQVSYVPFKNQNAELIDQGIALYFTSPNSFTGEDVVELQGHGGPIVMDMLLASCLHAGARQAQPGEFSERAFLNGKIDLTQAEAIADLIESTTEYAAKGAMQSLQGVFSEKIHTLLSQLIELRMFVEAAIDFPEEEVDFLAEENVLLKVESVQQQVAECLTQTQYGEVLKNGLKIVLAGAPNAGKSSLLNTLAGTESAIVTDIPGTTRDRIEVSINLNGFAVHITDTAGLRDSDDAIERIGIERSHQAMELADHILYLIDIQESKQLTPEFKKIQQQYGEQKVTPIWNKVDLYADSEESAGLRISAKENLGLAQLEEHIRELSHSRISNEAQFTARRRHIHALEQAHQYIAQGKSQLIENKAGELLAQELLMAQNALNSITGEFSADDLLGEIFSGFCIGK